MQPGHALRCKRLDLHIDREFLLVVLLSSACAAVRASAQALTWLACEHAGKHHHGAAKHGHGAYSALLCCPFVWLIHIILISYICVYPACAAKVHHVFRSITALLGCFKFLTCSSVFCLCRCQCTPTNTYMVGVRARRQAPPWRSKARARRVQCAPLLPLCFFSRLSISTELVLSMSKGSWVTGTASDWNSFST